MAIYSNLDYGEEDGGWRSKLKKLKPKKLTATRIAYAFFLFFGFIVALFLREGLFGFFDDVPFGRQVYQWFFENVLVRVSGTYAVYRICFGCFMFFLMFAILASRLFCVGDKIRLYIQHKWFILKLPLFLVFMVVPFFIPDVFFYGFAWFSLVMACIFIIVQLIILIDFSFSSAEWFRSKGDDSSYGIWDYIMLGLAILFYILGLTFIVLEFVFFGSGSECHLNRFFICFTIVCSIISTIMSMVLKRGVYPTGLIFLYTAFLCWTALTSYPSESCNTLASYSKEGGSNTTASSIITIIISLLISVFAIVRSAISTGLSFSSFFTMNRHPIDNDDHSMLEEDETDENDETDEAKRTECSEMFYAHIVFMFSSCYMSCVLVNWDILSSDEEKWTVDHSLAAMWVKIVSQWICILLFCWAIVAPKILSRFRDFDD